MSNAKIAKSYKPDFLQVDNEIKNITSKKEIVIMPSVEAWNNLAWTKQYFESMPKEGYFIWVKEQVDFPLSTCINIASNNAKQDLNNLMVIEKGIKAKANVLCSSLKKNLSGTHKAKGRLILKEGSSLEYNHIHKWGENDNVIPDYEFILEKGSSLIYNYSNLFAPKNLDIKNKVICLEDSYSQLNFSVNGMNSKIVIDEEVVLEGKNSQNISRLRLVGRKNSDITAYSSIVAKEKSKGHIECNSLMADSSAKIVSIPKLSCESKEAQITHEASIGKASEEQIDYLRSRGFTEKEAVDLIITGFLKL
jgi:hypothetical protein